MRILTSGLTGDISGSLAGVTFKRTAAGAVAQMKRTRPSKTTPATILRRSYLATLNATWHSFTAAQRAAWELIYKSLIAAGSDKTPRRFQSAGALFISHNLPRLIFGLATQTTPPTLPTANPPFHNPFSLAETTFFFIRFDLEPLLTGEYAFLDYSIPFTSSALARKIAFAYHLSWAGPRSAMTAVYPPQIQPLKTSRWAQLRRHSSSRLTSAPCLVKIDHI